MGVQNCKSSVSESSECIDRSTSRERERECVFFLNFVIFYYSENSSLQKILIDETVLHYRRHLCRWRASERACFGFLSAAIHRFSEVNKWTFTTCK